MLGRSMHRLPRPERLALLLLLALAVGAALLLPSGQVLGAPLGDMPEQFLPWRAFAADSLRGGHLPLWNPYTYAGEPFLGGFQSALLYPPNALFLFLPLARAANLSVFLHLLLLGWGLYRWAVRRGLLPLAGLAGAAVLALGGAVYPHVYAGHLSNLCAMAWAPWILGGLESWGTARRRAGLFEASAALCLQILSGHVQYVFLTAVAAGLQAVLWSAADPAARRRALPGCAAVYFGGALLAAAQLLPGVAAAAEGLRQQRLPFEVASSFFLPPENFLTLVAPGFFGDHLHHPYWGRWYLAEASVFIGAAGLVLVLIGARVRAPGRRPRLDLALAALLLLLALGASTPLYRLLYEHAPLFGQFRGMSKFAFPAAVFLALLAGAGADALLRGRALPRGTAAAALGAALVLGAAGALLRHDPQRTGEALRSWVAARPDGLRSAETASTDFAGEAAPRAGGALLAAAGLFLALGASLAGLPRRPGLRWVPLTLLAAELAAFAAENVATCTLADAVPPGAAEFVSAHPGDYRVLTVAGPGGFNGGYLLGASDIWGNDPSLLRRYAEFMAFTQGADPDEAGQFIRFRAIPRLYALLRLRYVLAAGPGGRFLAHGLSTPPLARVQLVTGYEVRAGRDALFAAMSRPDFDPARQVLLESEPSPRPAPGADPGAARVVEDSSDALTIEADARAPSLLLVTDLYSRDWRARALPGSSQATYAVMPADYVLRAIPLAAGHHRLRLEYRPPSFHLGLLVSLAAWAAWLAAAMRRGRRGQPPQGKRTAGS
jgi:hypothetical protein